MAFLITAIVYLLVLASVYYYPHVKQEIHLWRWYKNLSIKKHHQNYLQLFAVVDGFALSRQARLSANAFEYTYGEIDFLGFIALLSLTRPHENTIFYDLGSGVGKAVVATAMVFKIRKAFGIELFAPLHQAALHQKKQLQQIPFYQEKAANIFFIQNDFLNVNFYDATLIFINATAFLGDVWETLQQRLAKTHTGTIVITTSKTLNSSNFLLLHSTYVLMSWGVVMAFIHKKR